MHPTYEEREVICGCGKTFQWTVGQQKFMNSLLQSNKIKKVAPPKRCEDCRELKRKRFKEDKNSEGY